MHNLYVSALLGYFHWKDNTIGAVGVLSTSLSEVLGVD